MSEGAAQPGPIRRRRVYYIAGFDTRSARGYHEMFTTEAARQQAVSGVTYEVGPQAASGPHSATWSVRGHGAAHAPVETTYTFLAWNDIVRQFWPPSSLRVASKIPGFYWPFWRNGALARTAQLSRGFWWMLMLPLLFAVAGLVLTALLAPLAGVLASRVAPGGPAGWIAFVAAALFMLWFTLFAAERSRAFWLMRAWPFLLLWARQPAPYEARWQAFARQIEDEQREDPVDEVLVFGHSAGAMVAIVVAARWLALPREGPPSDRVKLATLGNATPMVNLVPEAQWFRDCMATVGASDMPWVEFTAPGDLLCYALVDPFVACGMQPPTRSSYRIRSSRFDRMFTPARYAQVRRDIFRTHFQYLMASELPVDNDWFQIVAGPRPLG